MKPASAFAPATVANLGPGFDVLGLAVDGAGDTVTASLHPEPGVRISRITGDGGALPTDADRNTAAIAARETLKAAGFDLGVSLEVHKGLPLCSGLGSSAASAAAAAFATNQLIGSPLRKPALVGPCIEAEAAVSGRHADNVAPALLGGLILVRSVDPIDLVRLPVPDGLTIVVVTPDIALPTKDARAVLPQTVPLPTMVHSTAQIASLVSACYSGDLSLLSRCLVDDVVTPSRLPLIPGGEAAIDAALAAGALGASISGAGPSLFALCRSSRSARGAATAMCSAFAEAGLKTTTRISPASCPGARRVER
jgi:homoserine kinase